MRGAATSRDLAVIIWVTHTGPGTAGTGSQVSAGSHMWTETRGYVTENVEQDPARAPDTFRLLSVKLPDDSLLMCSLGRLLKMVNF